MPLDHPKYTFEDSHQSMMTLNGFWFSVPNSNWKITIDF